MRQIQIALLAGLSVEFDQPHLDLGMARRRMAFVRPEDAVDVVGHTAGDVEQPPVARAARIGDRSLEEMPGTVEFVAVLDVAPALVRLDNLPVGVQIAVVGLGRFQQIDGVVGHLFQCRIWIGGQFVADGLQPLVDVRIHKHGRAIVTLARTGGQAQVVEIARFLKLGIAGDQADGCGWSPGALTRNHPAV